MCAWHLLSNTTIFIGYIGSLQQLHVSALKKSVINIRLSIKHRLSYTCISVYAKDYIILVTVSPTKGIVNIPTMLQ